MRLTEKSKPESREQVQRKNFMALTREEITLLRELLPFTGKRVDSIAEKLHAPVDGSLGAFLKRGRTAI